MINKNFGPIKSLQLFKKLQKKVKYEMYKYQKLVTTLQEEQLGTIYLDFCLLLRILDWQ